MKPFEHFRIASYMYAYYAASVSDDALREHVESYLNCLPLNKVYVENHRAVTDVPVKRLREIRKILEEYGLSVSGGITSTALIDGRQKPALFDTFCYSDPKHREAYLRIVREAAEVFDEIILDDYFFTSCRCRMCIQARGRKSWKDFRQEQMLEFSREIVEEAHRVNPKLNFIIKYPNWYESHQATGYNPGRQKDIFDMIYTGTETREPYYSSQHLQRYESYSIMRLLENAAPGRNGGGWIDLGGSSDNLSRFLEQAEFSLLGGAKELTLFNFPSLLSSPVLPALYPFLSRVDRFLGESGKPTGTAVWEPFDAEGEDQLCSYLGMCGAALEMYPEFPGTAPVILFTQRTACIPGVMEKLEAYVREGGKAVVTAGFVHETYDRGIRDMTSVRLTHRHAVGNQYMIDRADYDYSSIEYAEGSGPVMFEALDYKTNATWADVLMLSGESNFPVLTQDFYGDGRLFILNVPENFADLYRLPEEVIRVICCELSSGQPCYLSAQPRMSLIAFDSGAVCLHSFRPMLSTAHLIVRGPCMGVQDCEHGNLLTSSRCLPGPHHRGDAALTREVPEEHVFDLAIGPGQSRYLKILR